MHGAVDLVLRERELDFLGEQALAADLTERLIEILVAPGLERDELTFDSTSEEGGFYQARLTQRKLRGAAANPDYTGVAFRFTRHVLPRQRVHRSWILPLRIAPRFPSREARRKFADLSMQRGFASRARCRLHRRTLSPTMPM